jgi:hypothetical protein
MPVDAMEYIVYMCTVGEELALEDEKANHVVQSINDLVKRGNVGENIVAILFPGIVKTFPKFFAKVFMNEIDISLTSA